MKTIEELEKQINKLKSEIEELKMSEKKQGNRWKPDENQYYYFLNENGVAFSRIWVNNSMDAWRYNIGNCFRTKEEAEFEAERLEVIAELSEFAEGDDAVWDGCEEHWCINFSNYTNEIGLTYCVCFKHDNLYFSTIEAGEKAIKAVGEDRIKKYYLRMKEG